MTAMTTMMTMRRAALDGLTGTPQPTEPPFAGLRVDLRDHVPADARPDAVLPALADIVAGRLIRTGERTGPGAAVVAGLSAYYTDLADARRFHEALFRAVWDSMRPAVGTTEFRIKTGTISDGAIPIELYNSAWSFKDLHIDREVLLFSHLYGPVRGFSGGSLHLVDIRPYMSAHELGFDDLFEWSAEDGGSKPVLRVEHREPALAQCGIEVGAVGPDEIVFVNNLPDAGILHGVTPVRVTDEDGFHREYHRCSVKDLTLG